MRAATQRSQIESGVVASSWWDGSTNSHPVSLRCTPTSKKETYGCSPADRTVIGEFVHPASTQMQDRVALPLGRVGNGGENTVDPRLGQPVRHQDGCRRWQWS
jgi:hypothetical protein